MIFATTNITFLYVLLPASLLILVVSGLYLEMVLGLYLFLVVSDLRHEIAYVAQLFREVYVLSLVGIMALFIGKFKPIPKFYVPFIPFFVIGVLSSLISFLAFLSFQKTLSYLLIMVIFPAFLLADYRKNKAEALRKIVFFGMMILVVGFVLKVFNPRLVEFAQEGGRYKGIFGNPNGLGIFCVIYSIMYITIVTYYPILFSKIAKIFVIGSVILSVALCESRGAIFSIGILFVFNFLSKRSHALSVMVLIISIISYQWLLQNFEDIVLALHLDEYFRLSTLHTGSGRLVAFEFAWRQIQDFFFFGGGMGYTEYVFHAPEHKYYLSINDHQGNAHNSFLTIWLDTGIFGLIAFSYAWVSVIWRAHKYSTLAIPISFAIFFSAFFESWMAGSLNAFTIFLVFTIFLLTQKDFTQGDSDDELEIEEEPAKLEYAN